MATKRNLTLMLISATLCAVALGITLLGIGIANASSHQTTKADLDRLIAEIEDLGDNSNEFWTLQSWENLMQKLDIAIEVHKDADATPADIDKAYNDLFRARWDSAIGLRPSQDINKSRLSGLVVTVEQMINNWEVENYYEIFWTAASWQTLKDAFAEAKRVNAMPIHDEDLSQKLIDDVHNALNLARRSLVPIPNFELPPESECRKEFLGMFLDFVNSLNRGQYSDMSKWYYLRDARLAAEHVNNNPGATEVAISNAFYSLLNSYRDLLGSQPTSNPPTPVSPFILLGVVLVIVAIVTVAIIIDINVGRRSSTKETK
jgi:hypothetical protein